jgi:hypothetical protein
VKTNVDLRTVNLSAYPDLVVIYLGMRVRTFPGIKTLLATQAFSPCRSRRPLPPRSGPMPCRCNCEGSLIGAGVAWFWRRTKSFAMDERAECCGSRTDSTAIANGAVCFRHKAAPRAYSGFCLFRSRKIPRAGAACIKNFGRFRHHDNECGPLRHKARTAMRAAPPSDSHHCDAGFAHGPGAWDPRKDFSQCGPPILSVSRHSKYRVLICDTSWM